MTDSFLRGKYGMPFYTSTTAPTSESSPIAFEKNFNPMMKKDSAYFHSLSQAIGCVEKNVSRDLSEDQ